MTSAGLTPDLAAAAATHFGLGAVTAPPRPLAGFSPAGVWELDTVDGPWVVKATRPQLAWQLESMRRGGELELAAYAAGVAVPRPVPPPGDGVGLWLRVDDTYLRVSERMAGVPPAQPTEPEVAQWLGATVARIARLDRPAEITPASYPVHPLAEWADWLAQARTAGLLTGREQARLAAAVASATELIGAAMAGTPRFQLAHRDISRPNILVTVTGPVLLDFDHAGPEVAWWELLHHAVLLACARLGQDEPAATILRAAVGGYADAGGEVGPADPTAFAGLVRGMLEWAASAVWLGVGRRSLGPVRSAARRQAEAAGYVREASHVLPALLASLPRWSTWLH
ncbi:MAG: phosphotransferase [Micromonosporaceae bacterium]